MNKNDRIMSSGMKLTISLIAGMITAVILTILQQHKYILLGAWDIAALMYVFITLIGIRHADGERTKQLAERENPGRTIAEFLILTASVISLVAIFSLLVVKETGALEIFNVALSLISILISWITVHLTYMLRYARMYYDKEEGGVDFNGKQKPSYTDFAYLAFTLGMTYQVSDTSLQNSDFRKVALYHTLLSYIFGAVIIAATINTLVSLSQ